jgi:chromosome segregation ATPase
MSQPTQTQAAARAAEAELMNEIAFQKVLLASIDDSVQDRPNAENEVKAEIKALEKQLRDLKRRGTRTTSTASKTETSLSSQQSSEATSSASSTHKRPSNPTEEGHASGTAMDGFLSELSECFAFSRQNSLSRTSI